jgi:hypothetical protein
VLGWLDKTLPKTQEKVFLASLSKVELVMARENRFHRYQM